MLSVVSSGIWFILIIRWYLLMLLPVTVIFCSTVRLFGLLYFDYVRACVVVRTAWCVCLGFSY